MRAWQVQQHGEPDEALRLVDLDAPEPGPGEVRIRVGAAAVGLPDVFMCRGNYPLTPRLPFWELANARAQGWDAEGWPVIRRDGGDWALTNSGKSKVDMRIGLTVEVQVEAEDVVRPGTQVIGSVTIEVAHNRVSDHITGQSRIRIQLEVVVCVEIPR